MLFMHLHSKGNVVNSIFWGLWLFPLGMLVMRSGFLPRVFGMWLVGGGFGAIIAVSFRGTLRPAIPRHGVYDFAAPALFRN